MTGSTQEPSVNSRAASASAASMVTTSDAAGNQPVFKCLRCPRRPTFQLRKSFLRHIRTIHQLQDGFQCGFCKRYFARKDVFLRHEQTQHSFKEKTIACDICGRLVRPRSLPEHQRSRVCRQHAVWRAFKEVKPTYSIELLDAVQLSAWLFVRLKAWGPGEGIMDRYTLPGRKSVPVHVMELTDKILKSMRKESKADQSILARDSYLVDAISMINSVTYLTQGWEPTIAARGALCDLAQHQMEWKPGAKSSWVSTPPAEAYKDVLLQEATQSGLSHAEVAKCEQLAHYIIRVVRQMAYDIIYRPIKHKEDDVQTRNRKLEFGDWATRYKEDLVGCATLAISIEPVKTLPLSELAMAQANIVELSCES